MAFMGHPIVHTKTVFHCIEKANLDQRGDGLPTSSLPLENELNFFHRIAGQHTVFGVMAGAMAPEPDGQHFRSRAELAGEASRFDVGEVVEVQIEVGHGSTLRIEVVYEDANVAQVEVEDDRFGNIKGAAAGGNDDRGRSGWFIVSRMRRSAPENGSEMLISILQM